MPTHEFTDMTMTDFLEHTSRSDPKAIIRIRDYLEDLRQMEETNSPYGRATDATRSKSLAAGIIAAQCWGNHRGKWNEVPEYGKRYNDLWDAILVSREAESLALDDWQ